jgi:hypothetical protein
MYCPNCGSNNQPDINFCTRCGTNLSLVSNALGGKVNDLPQKSEQIPELLKRYYSGRHKMLLGAGSLAAVVALTALLFMSGLFWFFFWFFLGLFGYGTQIFNKGWNEWSEASSNLKALGYDIHAGDATRLAQKDSSPLAAPAARKAEFLPVDSSAAEAPLSVTENTTRHLDTKKYE